MYRSVTTELYLEAGQYSVMVKITATREKSRTTPEDVVKKTCQTRPEKLMAVGLSYDLAHAKGRLKESGLEVKERLRRERRDKRKLKAKKAFESQKLVDKKNKLKRLRLEAKEKAKKSREAKNIEISKESESVRKSKDIESGQKDKQPEIVQAIDNGIETIKADESLFKTTMPQGADDAVGGIEAVLHEGTSKRLKVTVEASDQAESAKGSGQTTSKKTKQPTEDSDKQREITDRSLKETKDESKDKLNTNRDTNIKVVADTEIGEGSGNENPTSTLGVALTTITESNSAAEDSNKADDQPNATLGNHEGQKIADRESTTETGGNVDKPCAFEPDNQFKNLTLDDISDDGLSWSSDIDAPPDSPYETDTDSDKEKTTPPTTDSSQSTETPADDFTNDPWNAVCVFGLRVYSKGSQAEIEVVGNQDDEASIESKKLDVDDQAADATNELQKGRPGEEKQFEIIGSAPAWDEESKQG